MSHFLKFKKRSNYDYTIFYFIFNAKNSGKIAL